MKRPEIKRLYRKAVDHWGLELQYLMLMEECAELIQAMNKVIRNGNKSNEPWRNLVEEMADVEIMIDQIKTVVSWMNLEPRVRTAKHDKLLRLKAMLTDTPTNTTGDKNE